MKMKIDCTPAQFFWWKSVYVLWCCGLFKWKGTTENLYWHWDRTYWIRNSLFYSRFTEHSSILYGENIDRFQPFFYQRKFTCVLWIINIISYFMFIMSYLNVNKGLLRSFFIWTAHNITIQILIFNNNFVLVCSNFSFLWPNFHIRSHISMLITSCGGPFLIFRGAYISHPT